MLLLVWLVVRLRLFCTHHYNMHTTPHSQKTKDLISLKKTGVASTKKGKKFPHLSGENSKSWKGGKPKCLDCNIELSNYRAKRCYAHKSTKESFEKMVKKRKELNNYIGWNKGKKGYFAGEKHYNWQGGITKEHQKIRNSVEIKYWKKKVLDRDNYTCQACGVRGGELNVDHELPFALYPDLRTEILNGRTLCKKCHMKIPSLNKHWLLYTSL